MANCSQISGEKPEVSLIPLNEEMIRMERMVGCNILLPEFNMLPGLRQESADEQTQVENKHCTHMQQTPHVHTYPSQILGNSSMANEIANNCDFTLPVKADSIKTARAFEHSDDCIASSLNKSTLNKSGEAGDLQTLCNGCKCDNNTTNIVSDINPSTGNSELDVQRFGALTCPTNNTSRFMQESHVGPMSTNITAVELSSPTIENKPFKPGELVNQLVEGPCIILPPSQLPVKPSYQISHALNQRQSTSIAFSNASNQGPPFQSSQSEALTHDSGSSACQTKEDKNQFQPTYSTTNSMSAGDSLKQDIATKETKAMPIGTLELSSEQATLNTAQTSTARPPVKRTPNDFVFGKVIGEGSYSTVYLAKEVSSQREFAIKVCDKKHLIRERKTHFVMREKEVLMKLDHPYFIKLAYTFQDSERLYYVLTYARNGELLGYLHKLSAFDVPCTRFYSAEIVLALEYLHGLGIIHRDLKPENILICEDMHIKITDFGTSKILSQDSGKAENQADAKRKNSFVGTAEYVSPEVLNNQPANFGSDLWGLGCIIYQCLSGSLPFRSGNEYQTFQKIVKAEYDFPEGFHPEAKDLVKKLLVIEPTERIGMIKPEGMRTLKNHSFYEEINWETLPESTPPKLMPYLPANANNPEFWGQEQRTGFDDQRLAEIITGQTADGSMSPELEELPIRRLSAAENTERAEKLKKQKTENQFHQFVQDNLIIKQGFVDKRKGLFARKRMLLLTEGPHLYYVDAHNKVLKGEIPWSKYLRPEAKNFKIFFVHTPNRTYYLESRQPDAQNWVKQIQDVWKKYYENSK